MLHDNGLDHLIDDDRVAVFELEDIEGSGSGSVLVRLPFEIYETKSGRFEALVDLAQEKPVLVYKPGGVCRVELGQGFSEQLLETPGLDREIDEAVNRLV